MIAAFQISTIYMKYVFEQQNVSEWNMQADLGCELY